MMRVDVDKLTKVLDLIQEDEQGVYVNGNFIALDIGFDIGDINRDKYSKHSRYIKYASRNLSNLLTTMTRLEWQRDLVAKEELDRILWSYFASTDIDMFHVNFRSAFDYIALLVGLSCDKPGQTPESFDKLLNWITRSPNNRIRIGENVADVIADCTWFGQLRAVRNSVVHHGGRTLVFPFEGHISFQVHQDGRRQINIPAVMYNENVVDFELYSALFVSYMIIFLEDISEAIDKSISVINRRVNPKSYHFGYRLLRIWISRLLSTVNTP